MTSYITDWSNHNSGGLSPSQAGGLIGFWHKTTDGDHWYADPTFKSHVDMARAAGVKTFGGYHVLWGNRDLGSQARWFVDRVRAQAPDCKVFMSDNEPFGYNGTPTIAQCNEFNRLVAEYAQVPSSSVLAYNPQWYYGSAISGLKYPWVQSNYGSNPSGPYAFVYQSSVGDQSSRWNGPTAMPFLQYGSNTDVGDANAFRGTLEDFLKFIGQPVIPAQEDDMLAHLWKTGDHDFVYVTGPLQFKREVTESEANSIRYYAGGVNSPSALPGFTLVDLTHQITDPAVIPGIDVATLVDSGSDVGPITVTGTLSGTLGGSLSGSVSGTVSGSVSGELNSATE